jgi:hypothetical protein
MNVHHRLRDNPDLSSALLERLRPMLAPVGTTGRYQHGNRLFSYCSIERERLKAIELPWPVIGIVLRGLKEVWLGETAHVFKSGTVFVLPGRVEMDVVNIPTERGPYESLLLEVPSLPPGMAPSIGQRPVIGSAGFTIPLDTDLVNALVHAATSIVSENAGDVLQGPAPGGSADVDAAVYGSATAICDQFIREGCLGDPRGALRNLDCTAPRSETWFGGVDAPTAPGSGRSVVPGYFARRAAGGWSTRSCLRCF